MALRFTSLAQVNHTFSSNGIVNRYYKKIAHKRGCSCNSEDATAGDIRKISTVREYFTGNQLVGLELKTATPADRGVKFANFNGFRAFAIDINAIADPRYDKGIMTLSR